MKDDFNQSSILPVAVLGDNFKFGTKLDAMILNKDQMPAYHSADTAIDPEEQRQRRTALFAQETYGPTTISLAYYSMRINGIRPVDQFLEPQKHDSHYQEMLQGLSTKIEAATQTLDNMGEVGKSFLSTATPSGLNFLALGLLVDEHVDEKVTYMYDKDRYGMDDFYQHPAETAMYKTGDCEDFAFLKRQILRDHGVPNENVFLIAGNIGQEKQNGTYDAHATLLLKDEKGDFYIFDNDKAVNPIPYEKYKKDTNFKPWLITDDDSLFLADTPPPAMPELAKPSAVQKPEQAAP